MVFSRRQLDVVAGIIFSEGKFLVTRRPEGSHLEGFWEFPGGKIKSGETEQNALTREIREELNLNVQIRDEFHRTEFEYPDRTVHIRFFLCNPEENQEPEAVECDTFRWVTSEDLAHLPFPPADVEVLDKLKFLDTDLFAISNKPDT